ncbi:MAG: carboxylating nicotinate-nucleotide diphosphorylase [Caldimicrobium sp.]|nr:carboxylating nicotinate-nucleotide diphosphorylase [Caldimicrobium sp.]
MNKWQISEIVQKALSEDLPFEDLTSELLIEDNLYGEAYFLAKEDLVVCGIPVVEEVFQQVDGTVELSFEVKEGEEISKGTKFGFARGKVKSLLKGERVALNFLQHLSGIATMVRRMQKKLSLYGITLLDTRKTLPGLKVLQKYAVRVGGGQNHRFSLSDGLLIKDNHIKACGGLEKVLEKLNRTPHYAAVEIEVKSLTELSLILECEANISAVLLDNFSQKDLEKALDMIKKSGKKVLVEVSGGVKEENLDRFLIPGIDYLSSGAITHSVKAVDISFKIDKVWKV